MNRPTRTEDVSFDHLVHWVEDLPGALARYDAAGLVSRTALTMPGFRNGAWPVDDERYVEVATVDDWDAARTSAFGHGLEVLRPAVEAAVTPGPVTFCVHVPDVVATADRLRTEGHEVEEVHVRLEDPGAGFVEAFVAGVPPWYPFLISYDPARSELARMRAEHRAEHGPPRPADAPDLVALLARSPRPQEEAARLAGLIGCPWQGSTVLLPGAEVRIEPAT